MGFLGILWAHACNLKFIQNQGFKKDKYLHLDKKKLPLFWKKCSDYVWKKHLCVSVTIPLPPLHIDLQTPFIQLLMEKMKDLSYFWRLIMHYNSQVGWMRVLWVMITILNWNDENTTLCQKWNTVFLTTVPMMMSWLIKIWHSN